MKKSHVHLNTKRQNSGVAVMKYNYGFGKKDDSENLEEQEEEDFEKLTQVADNLRKLASDFQRQKELKIKKRDPAIRIEKHIDFIKINFLGQFAVSNYFYAWYKNFGLEAVEVTNFGSTVLFAVVSELEEQFKNFLNSIETLFLNVKNSENNNYSRLILYIDSFELLRSDDLIQSVIEKDSVINLKLADLAVNNKAFEDILENLIEFLKSNEIKYEINEELGIFEILNNEKVDLEKILNNFDLFIQVTSTRATLIRPNKLNRPVREYGFTINIVNNLPTVGVIDSGISMRTPLAPLIIVDEDLNTTSTSVIDDNISDGQGHGTAVGGLVALGEEGINSNYMGNLTAHCMLLPIKIIDENNKYLFISSIIDVLYKTKKRYPYVKIFTLTVNFEVHKLFNENYSNYAYALDKFSFENDCLIFISTGNNVNAINRFNNYDLVVFNEETSNINVPAESLNNMTVGACANSFKQGDFAGISDGKEFPTMYSRRGHYNYALLNKGEKVNKLLFKPDLVMAGGDYCFHGGFITFEGNASMTVISADPTESFYNQVGTSFAAPLAANIAVRLQGLYPNVTATTLKALMINHCTDNLVIAENKQLLIGHGNIDVNNVLYSGENKITFIIEETIDNEQIKTYPITLPSYLYNDDLGKENGILKVTATICYNFLPIKDNQLGYCPVNIAMGFFRNLEHADILDKEENIRSKFKNSLPLWTQNSRFKTKPIPFSNVQKVSFPINVSDIKEGKGVFKLGVHCFVHSQLRPGESNIYLKDNRFSIILTVEETLRQEKITGRLYDEIIAVNDVTQLIEVEGIAELEN